MRYLALLAMMAAFPKFEQFPAGPAYKGKPAEPVLRTARQRTFRTRIVEAAKEGANFAGHYRIAEWGCGAGCVAFAFIDVKSGAVYDAPFSGLAWSAAPLRYEGTISSTADDFRSLAYRIDSRLLIARGCPEEKDCGSYFYEWTGTRLKLIRKEPAAAVQ